MKVKSIINVVLLMAGVSFGLVSCSQDPNTTKLQFMPDMADGPTVKAYEDFLNPPDHSIAMNAILYPDTAEESEKLLQNPFASMPDQKKYLASGEKLWNSHCTVCHGTAGKGDGPVVGKYPQPPDITTEIYKNRGDGFFFHRITFGNALMPGYGHSIAPHERWEIVMHLRTLQKAAQ